MMKRRKAEGIKQGSGVRGQGSVNSTFNPVRNGFLSDRISNGVNIQHSKLQEGVAMIVVVIFMFTLAIMGLTFLAMMDVDVRELSAQNVELQAFYVAEAGLEKAKWRLRKGDGGNFFQNLEPGKNYDCTVTSVSPTLKEVKCTGTLENVSKIVQAQYDSNTNYSLSPGTWKIIK